MLDTVRVWFDISPEQKQLESWASNPITFPGTPTRQKYFRNSTTDTGAVINFVYYPRNPGYKHPWLGIQASLPKVLFGNNVAQITTEIEIEEAAEIINQSILKLPWMPNVDVKTGLLWRLDAAYNHQVGPYVQNYITGMHKLEYPQRKTRPYQNEGVKFVSRVAETKFYDKGKECRCSSGAGFLRQEVTLKRTYYINRRLGLDNPTLKDIKIDLLEKILKEDLKKLGLEGSEFMNGSKAHQKLLNMYGYNQGNTLFGHWSARQNMTRKQMVSAGANRRTLRSYDKRIIDAGISMAMVEDELTLPGLRIGRSDGKSLPTVVSNT